MSGLALHKVFTITAFKSQQFNYKSIQVIIQDQGHP